MPDEPGVLRVHHIRPHRNILGIIRPYPRHPTPEVRRLPMSLGVRMVPAVASRAEEFLEQVARTADGR